MFSAYSISIEFYKFVVHPVIVTRRLQCSVNDRTNFRVKIDGKTTHAVAYLGI